ncbi:hypothetical protein LN474_22550, partial [Xanthomonas codiaei]|uniref:hypothetical protein n=1 Tax=Xanthomonas codiaei TaxID=56463 RepID=UPI001E51CA31
RRSDKGVAASSAYDSRESLKFITRSKDLAGEVARHVDKGGRITAIVSNLTGGSQDKRSLGVNLEITKA